MQNEINIPDPDFKPIKLTIIIENPDELCELFILFGQNKEMIKEQIEQVTKGYKVGQFNRVKELLLEKMRLYKLLKP